MTLDKTLTCALIPILLSSCAPVPSAPFTSMADSIKVVTLATPAPSVAPSVAPTPDPAFASLDGIPDTMLPVLEIGPQADESLITKPYEADDFSMDYAEADWAPDPITSADRSVAVVMKLHFSGVGGALIAASGPATMTLAKYLLLAEQGAGRNKLKSGRTTLAGVTGFQVESDAYSDGKKYFAATSGFVVDGKMIAVTAVYDPASKDIAIIKQEVAAMLASWKWRHAP